MDARRSGPISFLGKDEGEKGSGGEKKRSRSKTIEKIENISQED